MKLLTRKEPEILLPTGMTELEAFIADVCKSCAVEPLPSYKHAISTMIMHLDPTVDRMPRSYFARAIRKAQSNQVAYAMIEKIRKDEKEKAEAEKQLDAKTPPEATHSTQSEPLIEKGTDTSRGASTIESGVS